MALSRRTDLWRKRPAAFVHQTQASASLQRGRFHKRRAIPTSNAMPSVLPSDLLSMSAEDIPRLQGTSMPMVIHQSWKSSTLPPILGKMVDTWQKQYPQWLHVLWLDADNRKLVQEHRPEYLEMYDAFPSEIYRADFARNLYVSRFGGIYVDLDYDSFKPLDDFLTDLLRHQPNAAFLAEMPPKLDDPGAPGYEPGCIYNAWMASSPGHRLWGMVMEETKSVWYGPEKLVWNGAKKVQDVVGFVTGPYALTDALERYRRSSASDEPSVVIVEPKFVTPCAWYPSKIDPPEGRPAMAYSAKGTFDLDAVRRYYDNGEAFCATYWTSTWKSNWAELKDGEDETIMNSD